MDKKRWKLSEGPRPSYLTGEKPKIHPKVSHVGDMPDDQKKVVLEIKNYIKKLLPDSKIFLFGSRVHGNWDEFSDYDILVVSKQDIDKFNILKKHDFGVKVDLFFSENNTGSGIVEVL